MLNADVGAKDKDKKKELSVKQIMGKAHGKDGLRKKVIDGDASNDEKKALIDLYTALTVLKSPNKDGDADDWKARTKAVVELVKDSNPADLKKIDCKGCHDNHKPKKKAA
ncbi:MAG: hypothetical protein HY269_05320 [Deltaproteobacteria bacterium]|nr:hypothetical protein [Deltaproteobacteria bacterium]